MFFIIGLGLNENGISKEGLEAARKCKKIYLENYTVDFPYSRDKLSKSIGKKTIPADREFVEGFGILDEAKKEDVAMLVYGNPLMATTHISLIEEAKKRKIKFKTIHAASILDAVAETGLQIYKFGKIASMPKWQKSYWPESMMETVKENLSINAHTLILVDIGLDFKKALEQLEQASENQGVDIKKILACQKLGTDKSKIIYGEVSKLRDEKMESPFCMIIPGKLHFLEAEILEKLLQH